MRPTSKSLLTIALLATGCVAAAPGEGGSNGKPVDDNDPSGELIQLSSNYKLSSTFQIGASLPGPFGDALREITAATDEGDDPAKWMLQKIIDNMSSGTLRSTLNTFAGFAAGYLNDRLTSFAPNFVPAMKDVGARLNAAMQQLGTVSELKISKNGTQLSAVHTVVGVRFGAIDTAPAFLFASNGMSNIAVDKINIDIDRAGPVSIAEHKVPLTMGKVAVIALNQVVIPSIDPNARNLGELFTRLVNCDQVGSYLATAVGFGTASVYAAACRGGLTFGANSIVAKLEAQNGVAFEFTLKGKGFAEDGDSDNVAEAISGGTWSGAISSGGTPANLVNAKFEAEQQ